MAVALHITPSLIRRRYDQGLDSIVRLIADLEDRIEDLRAMQVAAPQRLIHSQMARSSGWNKPSPIKTKN